jgi:hypothetical protein
MRRAAQARKHSISSSHRRTRKDTEGYYGLYELRGFDQLYLSATDNLLDVQLLWSKLERKEAAKKSKGLPILPCACYWLVFGPVGAPPPSLP